MPNGPKCHPSAERRGERCGHVGDAGVLRENEGAVGGGTPFVNVIKEASRIHDTICNARYSDLLPKPQSKTKQLENKHILKTTTTRRAVK